MKILNALVIFVLAALLVSSCQKELDFENIDAVGTLKSDTSFDCLPSTVYGAYITDSILTVANYIEVQVNTTATGNYTIQSDSTNGYSFSGTGAFGNIGLNTVKLYGSGKPLIPGLNQFIIHYGTSFCTIDVNVEVPGGPAAFTLAGAGGSCAGTMLNGLYMAGLPTNSSNTAEVSVNVTGLGNYAIATTSINGVSFSGSGAFTFLGAQTVFLTATGTPVAAGSFNYAVSGGGGSGCAFSVTFDPQAPPAVYTLGGSPGSCTGATLTGIYAAGTAMTSNNTLTINVSVTTAGIYSITSNAQNGVSFSGSGLLNNTTTQVVLTASGIPAASGPFNFNITGGGNTCTVAVPFTAAATDFIRCNVDGVLTTFNENITATYDSSSGIPILSIDGSATAAPNPAINLGIVAASGVTSATTYTTNQVAAGNIINCDYYNAAGTDFFVGSDPLNQTGTPKFTIVITSISATRVTGTFSGTVKENTGAGPLAKVLTNGTFSVPL